MFKCDNDTIIIKMLQKLYRLNIQQKITLEKIGDNKQEKKGTSDKQISLS